MAYLSLPTQDELDKFAFKLKIEPKKESEIPDESWHYRCGVTNRHLMKCGHVYMVARAVTELQRPRNKINLLRPGRNADRSKK